MVEGFGPADGSAFLAASTNGSLFLAAFLAGAFFAGGACLAAACLAAACLAGALAGAALAAAALAGAALAGFTGAASVMAIAGSPGVAEAVSTPAGRAAA